MTLDMDFVESQFPALQPRDYAYFDNAGGSLVLARVARRIQEYLLTSSVQHGATYSKSRIAMERLYEAQESVAQLVNARRPEEIVMWTSTSALLGTLSSALGSRLAPGDEIIISEAEHEALDVAFEEPSQILLQLAAVHRLH